MGIKKNYFFFPLMGRFSLITLFFFPGTYINMQDAFAVEKGGIGSWMEIGYSAPGDNQNATSTTTTSGSYKTNNFVYYEGALGVWNAKANTKLNDCLTTSAGWSLTPTYIGTGANEGSVNYTTGAENVCTALTPSFKGLARALGGSGT